MFPGMSPRSPLFAGLLLSLASFFTASPALAAAPLKALLITGGCCHNYAFQTQALTEGVNKTAAVQWTVINEGGRGTRAQIPFYNNPDWAKGYDVVVHNECFADTADEGYIRRIVAGHGKGGTPAVVIHCAMHSYRAATIDDWREFLGVTSRRHDHQSRYPVKLVAPEHPAIVGFKSDWITPMDELYIIEKVWPKTTVLAVSPSERDAREHAVVWTNDYQGTRVFGTTYGHSDDTFRDPVFIDLLTRGLLWAAGRR
jgi:type 1 glutamine amidotransferase